MGVGHHRSLTGENPGKHGKTHVSPLFTWWSNNHKKHFDSKVFLYHPTVKSKCLILRQVLMIITVQLIILTQRVAASTEGLIPGYAKSHRTKQTVNLSLESLVTSGGCDVEWLKEKRNKIDEFLLHWCIIIYYVIMFINWRVSYRLMISV